MGAERMEGSSLNRKKKELQYRQKKTRYYGMTKIKAIQKIKHFKLEIAYFPHGF